ncbi:T9SS type A sorting domain-containing protein [Pseudotamlana carrageenivorans]|uniref:Secretion system C-terminal sorting domain-containing protein n=1 Tax=Pseudotamlana carrageenivorans TaxID=2069432 RepID=A0A2I7SGA0_9FLAO|nr:T9SS type A sorting domain-containing protein [Tamlana carrageenivorans]AUS04874.1 hypothetical protein C1A40_05020 [Tamlana carrageenivorans]
MKTYIQIVFIVGFVFPSFAQITFNGCHTLFEDQDYIFDFISADATGRNVYSTIPIDGSQTCGGIGTCEFKLAWNDASAVWEFVADDGNGDFSNSYVIYSNTTPSSPNPPSLSLGSWVENTSVTESHCGGALSTSNAVLTGDVEDSLLSTDDFYLENQISVYPNPVRDLLNITHPHLTIDKVTLFSVLGKLVLETNISKKIDVSGLDSGIYFLKIESNKKEIVKKIVVN